MRPCRYNVKIARWDVYRISHVAAGSPAEAEEKALEAYEESSDCEHVDGGVDHVEAEPDDD